MMKRVTWFASGAVAGVVGAGYAKRKVRATASQLAPAQMARGAADRVKSRARDVGEAVREGRDAMRTKEQELKARVDGRVLSLDEALAPGDQVIIDGRAVEPGQVIVLRDVRDAADRASRRRRRSR
jgi:hypothetical protein